MSEGYTLQEINKAIEFLEEFLEGMDEIISSHTFTSEETKGLYQKRAITLMVLNQWKLRRLAADAQRAHGQEGNHDS